MRPPQVLCGVPLWQVGRPVGMAVNGHKQTVHEGIEVVNLNWAIGPSILLANERFCATAAVG